MAASKRCSMLALLLAFCAIVGSLSCSWTDKDSETFYGMLIVGTVIGTLFGIICCVFACLPLCCSIMKPQAKIIAWVVILIGIFICFIPGITGKAQGDAAVNKMCERCDADANNAGKCSEDDKTKAKDAVGALGVIVAYMHGFGFVVVILGVTAAIMGCCICCKCCKMKDDEAIPGGMVTGQPVGGSK